MLLSASDARGIVICSEAERKTKEEILEFTTNALHKISDKIRSASELGKRVISTEEYNCNWRTISTLRTILKDSGYGCSIYYSPEKTYWINIDW